MIEFETSPVYRGRKLEELLTILKCKFMFETSPVYRGRKLVNIIVGMTNISLKLAPYIGDGNFCIVKRVKHNACSCLKLAPYIGDGNFTLLILVLCFHKSLKLAPYIGDGNFSFSSCILF